MGGCWTKAVVGKEIGLRGKRREGKKKMGRWPCCVLRKEEEKERRKWIGQFLEF